MKIDQKYQIKDESVFETHKELKSIVKNLEVSKIKKHLKQEIKK